MSSAEQKYDPVRAAAVEIIGLVETGKQQIEEAVHAVIEENSFDARDIRFLRQLVNGTVKLKRRLDHDIRFFLSRPSEKLPRRLIDILRLGFFQLFFTDKIPEAAAVSESVNLARHFCDSARARLVNAVMRAALRHPERIVFVDKKDDPVSYLANYYSYPDWFITYCLEEFKSDGTEKLLQSMNQPPHLNFRANHLKAKPEEVARTLQKAGTPFTRGKHLPEFFHLEEGNVPLVEQLVQEGKIYIMDESAGMAVRLLNPKPGLNVLDLAAAPGGKACYAAVRMRNKGMVTAVDRSRPRLELLARNCKRMGIKIVYPVHADNLEFKAEPFERVILDAPCTGWGNAGKHSDLRWTKAAEDVDRLHRVQSMMLDRAAKLVKPGGILVYSTCTIIRRENDQVVEEFLIRRNDFKLESALEYFDGEVVSERGFLKTYPNKPGLSGAFAARLKKILKT
ncbi:MAG: 16S rRNA (cytosine(967)-C(5))-methyltransferase RsmB [Candidatus Zixiibacteriota bacterium]|nr:MAG: 16S rRNA (cytosine(967)-C(5))-methyltransferase RsmB [candidate division Zixibacteria bacterium]